MAWCLLDIKPLPEVMWANISDYWCTEIYLLQHINQWDWVPSQWVGHSPHVDDKSLGVCCTNGQVRVPQSEWYGPRPSPVLLHLAGRMPAGEKDLGRYSCQTSQENQTFSTRYSINALAPRECWCTVKSLNIRCTKSQNLNVIVSSCGCFCAIY